MRYHFLGCVISLWFRRANMGLTAGPINILVQITADMTLLLSGHDLVWV